MAKNLDIPWDATIPDSYTQFSETQRTLGGGNPAEPSKIDPASLDDHKPTLIGKLGRKPASGEFSIPDDRERTLRVTRG